MGTVTLNQPGHVTSLLHGGVSDLLYSRVMTDEERLLGQDVDALRLFGALIRRTREGYGWSQDDLAERASVSRPTINRYEQAKTRTPDPQTARRIFKTLRLDPRRVPVILGYVTAEEVGLEPEPPRVFTESVEEAIRILQDPTVDPATKEEWVAFLRFRSRQRDREPPSTGTETG
jgi:transcriptional regulator with XRE-family HTH domain